MTEENSAPPTLNNTTSDLNEIDTPPLEEMEDNASTNLSPCSKRARAMELRRSGRLKKMQRKKY